MKNFSMKKLYYSISEVSRITDLEQYVLRYWETEFEQLKPAKNSSGNRIYTNKDIKLILLIKKLLPAMIECGGSIINVTSDAGVTARASNDDPAGSTRLSNCLCPMRSAGDDCSNSMRKG